MKITDRLRALMRSRGKPSDAPTVDVFRPPSLPDGVADAKTMLAMDECNQSAYAYANSGVACGTGGFMGYPLLAELSQLPEYRMLAEKPADAMTRKWIKLTTKGDGDKTEVLAKLTAAMEKFKLREHFRDAAKYDNFFGGCHLYIDTGDSENPDELKMPLIVDKAKIKKGALRGFKLIEPLYTYPYRYNSTNPLAEDYYNPRAWLVMAKEVHVSRLLHFVSRPVPNLLKPSYNFNGLSMSQLAKPYVDNWIKTRNSVNKIISNFSISGIKTNMSDSLAMDDCGDDLVGRAQLFNEMRDNQGLFVLDNNIQSPEEFFQFNVPLTTLDALQAQAQEHLASVSGQPLVILTGITPAGLNASSEGEIQVWYDRINGDQHNLFDDNLLRALQVIQLSEFGKVDDDIGFEYVSLQDQDPTEASSIRKSDAETADIYINAGIITPDEVRTKVAADPESGYTGLQGLAPEPPEVEDGDPNDEGDDDAEKAPSRAG